MNHPQPHGFLAIPPAGGGHGVLVLHAWWGLNDTVKAFCTRLAEAGFTAFAPDLYHGKVTDSVAEAETLSEALFENLALARAGIAEATAFLEERAGQSDRGLAVIGFSLGAFFALDLSVTQPEHIRAVVIFYGTRPGKYGGSKADYLGHFAEADEFEPQPNVDDLEAALKDAGRPATFYRYSGTGHWFCEADRAQAYNHAAASLAWDRTLAFLKGATHMSAVARGSFTVEIKPQAEPDTVEGVSLGRMSLHKRFEGDLVGTGQGEMLTALTPVQGSAGYVAIERVTGTLHGRSGSFVFQHAGIMDQGAQQLSISVVPGSGAGELAGIYGVFKLDIVDGRYLYEFEYSLP